MARQISGDWRLFILATPDRQEEERQMRAFLDHLDGKNTEPDFKMKLVGYCEDWGDVIETSTIVIFNCKSGKVRFTTHSGSVYLANMDEFGGFSCMTIRGEERIAPLT